MAPKTENDLLVVNVSHMAIFLSPCSSASIFCSREYEKLEEVSLVEKGVSSSGRPGEIAAAAPSALFMYTNLICMIRFLVARHTWRSEA